MTKIDTPEGWTIVNAINEIMYKHRFFNSSGYFSRNKCHGDVILSEEEKNKILDSIANKVKSMISFREINDE
jgi:hypothetical protein